MGSKRLVVYVSSHCASCPDAVTIAKQIERDYPEIEVEIFNVDEQAPHSEVFAVPTYMLNDRVVFLGNPTDAQLEELFGKPRRSNPDHTTAISGH